MPTRPPSSSGLGHHPFKVAARVRIPLGVRRNCVEYISGPVVKSGVHAGLSSRRSRVQVPSGPQQRATRRRKMASGFSVGQPIPNTGVERQIRCQHGRVAQLAEHTPEKRGVTGSTPVSTTIPTISAPTVPISRTYDALVATRAATPASPTTPGATRALPVLLDPGLHHQLRPLQTPPHHLVAQRQTQQPGQPHPRLQPPSHQNPQQRLDHRTRTPPRTHPATPRRHHPHHRTTQPTNRRLTRNGQVPASPRRRNVSRASSASDERRQH